VIVAAFGRALNFVTTTHYELWEGRKFSPYGLHGGADGKPGRSFVIGRDGAGKSYPGKATLTLESGEVVVVETPGGGWGTV
jgi:N-methylhydantoinase B/oxoprolinase/acetone carboxylase alpha subunit